MLSLASIVALLVAAFFGSYVIAFVRNVIATIGCGVRTVWIPFHHNHPIWMVMAPITRYWLERNLPIWIWKRIALTIGCHEMFMKREPYQDLKTDTYMLVTAGQNELWTSDPEVAYDILKRNKDFGQHPLSIKILSMFGPSLATSDGEQWSKQRKLITTIINERVSKVVFEESHRQANLMASELAHSDVGRQGSASLDGLKKIAINVLSRAGYGIPASWDGPTSEKYATTQSSSLRLDFVTCVKTAIDNLIIAALASPTLLLRLPAWLPGAHRLHMIGHAQQEYPVHARARVDEERAMLSDPAKQGSRNSIISQLVLNSDSNSSDSKSAGLTETEVFGNLFVFTAAGFDTTANALQFAIVLLAIHSDLQTWLYEEVLSIIGPYESNTEGSDDIEYAAIYPRAIRCQAFLMEVLRVHPPVVHSIRINKSGKTQIIKTSKHTIHVPVNTAIYTDSNAVQTDPKIWRGLNLPNFNGKTGAGVIETPEDVVERTQDEYRFRPGRWVMADNTLFKPPPGSFLPFAAGPRVCPGQKMAQVEFVGVIMTLLGRFKIVPNSRHGETERETRDRMQSILDDVRSELTIVMQKMNELDLRWEERVSV